VKTPIVVLASFIAATALAAVAADAPKKELTPQQQRMSDCSHESKGMKGDEHKKFMSDCLKSKSPPADVKAGMMGGMKPDAKMEAKGGMKPDAKMEAKGSMKGDGKADMKTAAKPTQQDKMKTCNADAGKKKLAGDERKKFMSECLKG
jgi:hypothetical protein